MGIGAENLGLDYKVNDEARGNKWYPVTKDFKHIYMIRPYKKKILVLRHRRALKIPPDETFLSWEGKKIAAARQISYADKNNPDLGGRLSLFASSTASNHLPRVSPQIYHLSSIPRFRNVKDFKQLFSS